MPAATLGFGRARNPESFPLFILALTIDLSCPSCTTNNHSRTTATKRKKKLTERDSEMQREETT